MKQVYAENCDLILYHRITSHATTDWWLGPICNNTYTKRLAVWLKTSLYNPYANGENRGIMYVKRILWLS